MRTTKTLALSAAVLAAGLAAASAQVYSANVVGYINVTLKPGLNLIANQLDDGTNQVSTTFSGKLPADSVVMTWGGAGFSFNQNYGDGSPGNWDDDTTSTKPGIGMFVNLPGTTNVTVTLVGNVPQGTAWGTNSLVAGLNLIGSIVPQAGLIDYDLGFTNIATDSVLMTWGGAGYVFNQYYGGGATPGGDNWDAVPSVAVGQGFFLNSTAAVKWVRNFTVQ